LRFPFVSRDPGSLLPSRKIYERPHLRLPEPCALRRKIVPCLPPPPLPTPPFGGFLPPFSRPFPLQATILFLKPLCFPLITGENRTERGPFPLCFCCLRLDQPPDLRVIARIRDSILPTRPRHSPSPDNWVTVLPLSVPDCSLPFFSSPPPPSCSYGHPMPISGPIRHFVCVFSTVPRFSYSGSSFVVFGLPSSLFCVFLLCLSQFRAFPFFWGKSALLPRIAFVFLDVLWVSLATIWIRPPGQSVIPLFHRAFLFSRYTRRFFNIEAESHSPLFSCFYSVNSLI